MTDGKLAGLLAVIAYFIGLWNGGGGFDRLLTRLFPPAPPPTDQDRVDIERARRGAHYKR